MKDEQPPPCEEPPDDIPADTASDDSRQTLQKSDLAACGEIAGCVSVIRRSDLIADCVRRCNLSSPQFAVICAGFVVLAVIHYLAFLVSAGAFVAIEDFEKNA